MMDGRWAPMTDMGNKCTFLPTSTLFSPPQHFSPHLNTFLPISTQEQTTSSHGPPYPHLLRNRPPSHLLRDQQRHIPPPHLLRNRLPSASPLSPAPGLAAPPSPVPEPVSPDPLTPSLEPAAPTPTTPSLAPEPASLSPAPEQAPLSPAPESVSQLGQLRRNPGPASQLLLLSHSGRRRLQPIHSGLGLLLLLRRRLRRPRQVAAACPRKTGGRRR